MCFWKSLLSEDNSISSMRFIMILVIITSNVILWGVWLFLCFQEGKMIDIPAGVTTVYGVANGSPLLAKAVQKFGENKQDERINNLLRKVEGNG